MRRLLGSVLAGVVLAGAACGGGGDAPEVAALKRQVKYLSDGQYDRLWEQLHPAQQAIIPKEAYVKCAAKARGDHELRVAKVTSITDEKVTVPGTSVIVASRAIKVDLELDNQLDTQTYHEIEVGDTWRFAVADPVAAVNC